MRKNLLTGFLAAIAAVSLAGCGGSPASTTDTGGNNVAANSDTSQTTPRDQANDDEGDIADGQSTVHSSADSLDGLKTEVEEYMESQLADIRSTYDTLVASIGSYDAYVQNIDNVEAFYDGVITDTASICVQLRQYSIDYVNLIVSTDEKYSDQYDDLEEVYDVVYDDAGEQIYDEIYDGVLSDAYDDFYDGIVSDGYDTVPYDDWSDVHSQEYDLWSDTRSDVYDLWSDCRSDIYDFWSDVRSDVYSEDDEDTQNDIADFQEDVNDLMSD